MGLFPQIKCLCVVMYSLGSEPFRALVYAFLGYRASVCALFHKNFMYCLLLESSENYSPPPSPQALVEDL